MADGHGKRELVGRVDESVELWAGGQDSSLPALCTDWDSGSDTTEDGTSSVEGTTDDGDGTPPGNRNMWGPSTGDSWAADSDLAAMYSSGDFSSSCESTSGDEEEISQWCPVPQGAPKAALAPRSRDAAGSPVSDTRLAVAASQKARDPAHELLVPELLALMRADRWDGTQPPTRPLRLGIQQSITDAIFREPRKHKRRQKVSVGVIDRWKNSGGKCAKLTLDIDAALQRDEANVLVVRHGRILQPGGPQLRYRQWSYGVQLPDGTLREDDLDCVEDLMLYQIFTEETMQAGMVAPLKRERATEAKKPVRLKEPVQVPACSQPLAAPALLGGVAEMDFGMLPDAADDRSSAEPTDGPARKHIAEMDFGLLPRVVAKRQFNSQQTLHERPRKHKRAAPTAAFLMGVAILSLFVYHRGSKTIEPAEDDNGAYSAGNATLNTTMEPPLTWIATNSCTGECRVRVGLPPLCGGHIRGRPDYCPASATQEGDSPMPPPDLEPSESFSA